jgi:RNA polymerase sigma factor (TIGR02999 family)
VSIAALSRRARRRGRLRMEFGGLGRHYREISVCFVRESRRRAGYKGMANAINDPRPFLAARPVLTTLTLSSPTSNRTMSDVTNFLYTPEQGDPGAASQLLPLVYDELRILAAQKLAQEQPGLTLEPTALVHQAYLRLVARPSQHAGREEAPWVSRGHFFAAMAEAMRRILVENARRRSRVKHGGGRQRVDLDDQDQDMRVGVPAREIIALDEALTSLHCLMERRNGMNSVLRRLFSTS